MQEASRAQAKPRPQPALAPELERRSDSPGEGGRRPGEPYVPLPQEAPARSWWARLLAFLKDLLH